MVLVSIGLLVRNGIDQGFVSRAAPWSLGSQ